MASSLNVLPPARVANEHGTRFQLSGWLLRSLQAIGDLLESRRGLCIVLMIACYLPVVWAQAKGRLLVNDEIYTIHIAQQPTVARMLSMAREIDLHPPLHYFLQRWALMLPGPRWLDARLPSMAAGLVLMFSIFVFTARRLGNLFGFVAACVFWFTPALDFCWVNRPYALWLALLSLLLVVHDVARRPIRPRWALPAVFLVTLCMVGTHLLGIACLLLFVVVELVRGRRLGRTDWALIAMLLLPAVIGAGYSYQFRHLSQNAFPQAQMPSAGLLLGMYLSFLSNAGEVAAFCLIAFGLIFGRKMFTESSRLSSNWSPIGFSSDDLLLLTLLLLLPIFLFVPALLLHLQFWYRYAAASMLSFAVMMAWFVAARLPAPRLLAAALAVCGISYMVYVGKFDNAPQTNGLHSQGGRWPIPLWSLDPSLPIVSASPMTFIEMGDREKAELAKRVYYLTDRQAANQYAHYTLFENEDKIRSMLDLPTQTDNLQHFLGTHPRFYVVGDYTRSEIWLLRKLTADKNSVQYLGKFESSYETDDLWLVTPKGDPIQGDQTVQPTR